MLNFTICLHLSLSNIRGSWTEHQWDVKVSVNVSFQRQSYENDYRVTSPQIKQSFFKLGYINQLDHI